MKKMISSALALLLILAQALPVSADGPVDEISAPGFVWQTVSSIGAKKQFWQDRVLNYAGTDDREEYTLVSVNNLTGISDNYGNDVKYVYSIDNGLQYYMYGSDNTFLECHWEPDGYSVSDSLMRTADNVAENTQLINMNTYDGRILSFELRNISVFTGYMYGGGNEKCLSANLKNPVQIRTGSGDVIVHSIQIFGDPVDSFCRNRGVDFYFDGYEGYEVDKSMNLMVSGELIEAHTTHHYTPVIMKVTGIY